MRPGFPEPESPRGASTWGPSVRISCEAVQEVAAIETQAQKAANGARAILDSYQRPEGQNRDEGPQEVNQMCEDDSRIDLMRSKGRVKEIQVDSQEVSV